MMSKDRLRLEDIITLPEINFMKVAVVTQMIYPDDPEKQSYETMLFSMETDRAITRITRQYPTEEEARKGHNQTVARLRMGMYKVIPIKWQIESLLVSNKEC